MQRYNDLSSYLKEKFGSRLLKLSIDGGFSCPNRKNGKSGCKFCSERGSGEFTTRRKSITEQLNAQINFLKDKDKYNGYIAYFQSYTNTFLPVEQLRKMYYEAINFPNVKVLSIATRADCFNEEIYNLLAELNDKIEVWIELGLQSSNENTRNNMNIGYSTETFENCVKRLKELNIKHKLIKPYTPRHNGKVERSHKKDQERFYHNKVFFSFEDLVNRQNII